MRLVGYARTRLTEQLGEVDLQEQERSLAEFCFVNNHELVHVVADDGHNPDSLEEALSQEADGLVVTDPLIIAADPAEAHDFAAELVKRNKHLFVVYKQKHIDPRSAESESELARSTDALMQRRAS